MTMRKPQTKSGIERYPQRDMHAGTRQSADGHDIGRAMLPQDIYVLLRRIGDLDDDEVLNALRAGAQWFAAPPDDAGPSAHIGMPADERDDAIAAAMEATRARLRAWRKRHRHMTWGELRVLLRGLTL